MFLHKHKHNTVSVDQSSRHVLPSSGRRLACHEPEVLVGVLLLVFHQVCHVLRVLQPQCWDWRSLWALDLNQLLDVVVVSDVVSREGSASARPFPKSFVCFCLKDPQATSSSAENSHSTLKSKGYRRFIALLTCCWGGHRKDRLKDGCCQKKKTKVCLFALVLHEKDFWSWAGYCAVCTCSCAFVLLEGALWACFWPFVL